MVLIAALLVGVPSVALSAPKHHHAGQIIPKFVGMVDASNVERFLNAVGDNQDKIIGIRVAFDGMRPAKEPANGYAADADDDQFVISYGTLESPGIEMVAPKSEASWQHGSYVLDGFYVVKSGGMHQGTLSYGLEKVDEGTVLLSTKYRVVERVLK